MRNHRLLRLSVTILLGSVGFPLSHGRGHAQEAPGEEILARCLAEMGGAERIRSLNTLSFTLHRSDGRELRWSIERPNRVRKEETNRLILVFDGKRAGFLERRLENGAMGGPQRVPPEDWHHFEMDVGLFVPAFLDHPWEYLGTEEEGDRVLHLFQVGLPMGGTVIYGVEGESYRLVRVRLPGWNYERVLDGFEWVDGLLLATRFWSFSEPGDISTLTDVRLNETFPDGFFTPEEGGAPSS